MTYNPKSLANLVKTKKGETLNPSGRPKGLGVWSYIKKHSSLTKLQLLDIVNNPRTRSKDLMAAQYLLRASNGDTKVVEYLINRELGTPTSHSEVNNQIQGLHFIGGDQLDNEQARIIADTVAHSEATRLQLLDTMNQALVDDESEDT
jgi:hypothetical protein